MTGRKYNHIHICTACGKKFKYQSESGLCNICFKKYTDITLDAVEDRLEKCRKKNRLMEVE